MTFENILGTLKKHNRQFKAQYQEQTVQENYDMFNKIINDLTKDVETSSETDQTKTVLKLFISRVKKQLMYKRALSEKRVSINAIDAFEDKFISLGDNLESIVRRVTLSQYLKLRRDNFRDIQAVITYIALSQVGLYQDFQYRPASGSDLKISVVNRQLKVDKGFDQVLSHYFDDVQHIKVTIETLNWDSYQPKRALTMRFASNGDLQKFLILRDAWSKSCRLGVPKSYRRRQLAYLMRQQH